MGISHAYVPRARGRSWGWGVGVRVWVSDRADAGPGGVPGLGFADAIRGRGRERESFAGDRWNVTVRERACCLLELAMADAPTCRADE